MYSQRNAFNTLIKRERKEQGLSAYRLSAISGVSRKAILDIENGAVPNLLTAEKLCKALNISYSIHKRR